MRLAVAGCKHSRRWDSLCVLGIKNNGPHNKIILMALVKDDWIFDYIPCALHYKGILHYRNSGQYLNSGMATEDIELENVVLNPTTRSKIIRILEEEQSTSKSSLLNSIVEVHDAQQGQLRNDVYLKSKHYSLIPAIITRVFFLAIIVG